MANRLCTSSGFSTDDLFAGHPSSPLQKPARSVAFKQYSQMVLIPEEKSSAKLCYSSEDIRQFRQQMLLDVQQLRRDLDTIRTNDISPDQVRKCIGLERFLSQDILARTLEASQAHTAAVLEEQHNQEQSNVYSAEKLSQVSMKSSNWSRQRAERIATGYLHLRD